MDEGRIIGAAAYPVRDQFQFVRTGSLLNLHGPVKWFHKHSYLPLGQAAATEAGGAGGEGTGALGVFCQWGEEAARRHRFAFGQRLAQFVFSLALAHDCSAWLCVCASVWCIVSCMVGVTASALLYVLRLKPMLAKKYLKGD